MPDLRRAFESYRTTDDVVVSVWSYFVFFRHVRFASYPIRNDSKSSSFNCHHVSVPRRRFLHGAGVYKYRPSNATRSKESRNRSNDWCNWLGIVLWKTATLDAPNRERFDDSIPLDRGTITQWFDECSSRLHFLKSTPKTHREIGRNSAFPRRNCPKKI